MGDDPKPVAAPQDSPEARRLTELSAQRLEYTNPLEKRFLQSTVPLQSQLTQQQYQGQIATQPYENLLQQLGLSAQIGLQPQEAALRGTELYTAQQRAGVIQGVLGGQVPSQYGNLLQPLSPVSLTGQPYQQAYDTARGQIESQQQRGNQQLLAQQNMYGILGSGGTAELLRRSQEDTNRQLGGLSTEFMSQEANRQNQQALLARDAENNLLSRQSGLLNLGMGIGGLAQGQGLQQSAPQSQLNPIAGAQSAYAGAANQISQQNALNSQNYWQGQSLGMQNAANQNAFFGDIFGGLLGAGAMLGGAALLSSRQFKSNIKNNKIDSISIIKDLNIVEFDYNHENKHHIGVIVEDSPEILVT